MAVPSHILHHLSVGLEDMDGIDGVVKLIWLINIPDADKTIIWPREELTAINGIPRKTKALLFVTLQTKVRLYLIVSWLGWVLEVVKDVNFSTDSLGRDNIVTLWHVSGSVDFSLVIDLSFNLNSLVLLGVSPYAIDILGVILIITSIFRRFKRDFYL